MRGAFSPGAVVAIPGPPLFWGVRFGDLPAEPVGGCSVTPRETGFLVNDFRDQAGGRILVAARRFLSNLSALVSGFQRRRGRRYRRDYRPAAVSEGARR